MESKNSNYSNEIKIVRVDNKPRRAEVVGRWNQNPQVWEVEWKPCI